MRASLIAAGVVAAASAAAAASFFWELPKRAMPAPQPAVVRVADGAKAPLSPPSGWALVHFWAGWCGPCRRELPELVRAAKRNGVPLVLVSLDRSLDDAKAALSSLAPDADQALAYWDAAHAARRAYAIRALPTTYLVRDGRIAARAIGPRDWRAPAAWSILPESERR
ncbi:MAG: hypothetical protein D6771_00160 [Zetaproteobacteria bacterium]|nr:MAG: hypothetical protein D6771_00160 [Zetaproteobacteria bacterium]